jgi:hypothetical protein
VMPDGNAELDGITMRGVLSICKAGLFTGGCYVEEEFTSFLSRSALCCFPDG